MILEENGYYWVGHDHKCSWVPKVEWAQNRLGACRLGTQGANSEDSWIEERAEFTDSYNLVRKPLRWGFRDRNMALMFVMAFPTVYTDDWRFVDE